MVRENRRAFVEGDGRTRVPREVRAQLGIYPGDVFAIEVEESGALLLARMKNTIDVLAQHAVEEYRAGRTRDLREIAAEEGIDPDTG
jgi:bifunctional DNA-binding transcriptional regulator/antitoxin component of YhaV-PrlF toxin-antitoxin module